MLAHQRLSYVSYMLLTGTAFLGKMLALPQWGRVAHYAGARRLLWIGGTAIVPVAALWIAADWFAAWQTTIHLPLGRLAFDCPLSAMMAYLVAVQLISGIVWAAYELAMMLMFFEAIPRHNRASVLTFYNWGNSAALVIGSLIGATVLQLGGESHAAYMALFGLSSLARLSTVLLLRAAPERPVEFIQPALRVVAVRPDEGGVDQPILSSMSRKR
jgi:MFS family permease